jgi:hypothetical protein
MSVRGGLHPPHTCRTRTSTGKAAPPVHSFSQPTSVGIAVEVQTTTIARNTIVCVCVCFLLLCLPCHACRSHHCMVHLPLLLFAFHGDCDLECVRATVRSAGRGATVACYFVQLCSALSSHLKKKKNVEVLVSRCASVAKAIVRVRATSFFRVPVIPARRPHIRRSAREAAEAIKTPRVGLRGRKWKRTLKLQEKKRKQKKSKRTIKRGFVHVVLLSVALKSVIYILYSFFVCFRDHRFAVTICSWRMHVYSCVCVCVCLCGAAARQRLDQRSRRLFSLCFAFQGVCLQRDKKKVLCGSPLPYTNRAHANISESFVPPFVHLCNMPERKR